jgi:hypothetical protein
MAQEIFICDALFRDVTSASDDGRPGFHLLSLLCKDTDREVKPARMHVSDYDKGPQKTRS